MSLESATFISDLNAANPTGSDNKSQGDDHIRLVKSALQATFPAGSRAHYPAIMGTATASTSGTSIDYTSIPSWATEIVVTFSGVSTSGTSQLLIQLGDSGGIETSGYLGASSDGGTAVNYTTGFGIASGLAANILHGSIRLTLADSATFTWAASGVLATSNAAACITVAGSKSTSAALDRIHITTVGGTDTFDAGKVNIRYA